MRNILISGGPGTGKTIISRAIPFYVGREGLDIEEVYQKDICSDLPDIERYAQSEFVEYIQIHPSMTYEDIVYGIDVIPDGQLTMAYAEKRIKKLCDRALGGAGLFFLVLDDIGRANIGRLLGNLLYAMEYRNQPVGLVDGTEMVIPDNVCLIMTECNSVYGSPLEYALRRRFDYRKELNPDADVLDRFYTDSLSQGAKETVLGAFEAVKNFVCGHIFRDPAVQRESYIPGHGMFLVERNGSETALLLRIRQKMEYQVAPYLADMMLSGILACTQADLDNLFNGIYARLNVGQAQNADTAAVEKIFCGSKANVPFFSLADSHTYYSNTVLPNCTEHRAIIENIIDAIFTNGIFPPDKALADILQNTNAVRFEHRSNPGTYAAFVVESDQNGNFGYLTTVSNHVRSYYSSNPCRTGRWAAYNDAPAYKVTFADGTVRKYISLNAFRNTGFDTNTRVIHAEENTASIYCALYHLVRTYLAALETEFSRMAATDPSYEDLYGLVSLEKRYWEGKNAESQDMRGSDHKLQCLAAAVRNLRTLWSAVGTTIAVDEAGFHSLAAGAAPVSAAAYENLFRVAGAAKSIEIKGVEIMVDLKDYQQIMENIGVRQMIFQGPPGTSKTFESKKFVLKQLKPGSFVFTAANPSQEDISNELAQYKLTAEDYKNPFVSGKRSTGGWDLVQFHPSYGYEDFIRGIEVKPVKGTPSYDPVNRILGKIAEFAKIAENAAGDGAAPKFYLIIDEINRANLATVFGELIYGLEYRNSFVSTPYEVRDRAQNALSKDIVLGKNLFIIGTMNTADKSIDAIDYAIRRRFIFIDSPAKREVVLNCYRSVMGAADENSIELLLFDAVGYLFEGNRFFNEEYQRSDVRIGHTYFLRTDAAAYREQAIEKFVFQVVPILREYVKDGIIDSFEDLKGSENSVAEVCAAAGEERIKKIGENIMLFVKHFGEKNVSGALIDNRYIADFIEGLCNGLG